MNRINKIGCICLLLIGLTLFSTKVFAIENVENNSIDTNITTDFEEKNLDNKDLLVNEINSTEEKISNDRSLEESSVDEENKINFIEANSNNSMEEANIVEDNNVDTTSNEFENNSIANNKSEPTDIIEPSTETNNIDPKDMSIGELEDYISSEKENKSKEEINELNNLLKEKYVDEYKKYDENYFSGDNGSQVENKVTDENYTEYTNLKSELNKILSEENPNLEELKSTLNKLESFNFPRANTKDELELNKEILNFDSQMGNMTSTDEKANEAINEWKEFKDSFNLNSENPYTEAEIKELNEKLESIKDKLNSYKKQNLIDVKLTENGMDTKVFLLDRYGNPLKNLKDETYYLPNDTSISLLYQIATDETKDYELLLTPKEIKGSIDSINVRQISINGKVYNFEKQDNGSYKVKFPVTPGVAEFRVDLSKISGEFHDGFSVELNVENTLIKKDFLVTKTGYSEDFDVKPILDWNVEKDKVNIPEIDAGKTSNDRVIDDKKIIDLMTYLSADSKWMDRVIVTSSPDPVDLKSLNLEIDLPKDGDLIAKFIEKGLKFDLTEEGKIKLNLSVEEISKNLEIKDDNLILDGEVLQKAELKNVMLFDGKNYVYVDDSGKVSNVEYKNYRPIDETNLVYFKDAVYNKDSFELVAKYKDGKWFDKDENLLNYNPDIKQFEKISETNKTSLNTEINNDSIYIYEDKFDVKHDVIFVDSNNIVTDNKEIPKGENIIIRDGDNEYYAGTVITNGDYVFIKNGKIVKEENLVAHSGDSIFDESGKLVTDINYTEEDIIKSNNERYLNINGKVYKIIKDAVTINNIIDPNYSFKTQDDSNRVLIGSKGEFLGYFAEKSEDSWKIYKIKDEQKIYTVQNIIVNRDNFIIDRLGKIVNSNDLTKVEEPYYLDVNSTVVKVLDTTDGYDKDKDVVYKNRTILNLLDEVSVLKAGDKVLDKTLMENAYNGVLNPNKYYQKDDNILYLSNENLLLDQNGNVVGSFDDTKLTVQTIGQKKIVYTNKSIYEIIRNATFGLNFEGFKAGKNYIYNLDAKLSGSYYDPKEEVPKKLFDKDFINVNKKFTLKNTVVSSQAFGKEAPYELINTNPMKFELFNLLFRSEDDRSRDKLFKKLFTSTNLTKEEQSILDMFKEEYHRIYKKDLVFKDGRIQSKDDKGQLEEVNRKLVWSIFFNNNENFPNDVNSSVVIDDAKLDNRLVYDSIVINASKSEIENLEKISKESGEEFKGDKTLISIDELDSIYLGVNPYYTKGEFIPVTGFKITADEIKKAIADSSYINKDGINIKVSKDDVTGKIYIYVKDAFLDKDGNSPVQLKYSKDYEEINKELENAKDIASLKKIISNHYKNTPCEKELLAGLEEVEKNSENVENVFKNIKSNMQTTIKSLKLVALKDNTLYKDGQFNAIRIRLNPGEIINSKKGNTRKILIQSVIKNNVDIPYTNEFGDLLTNEGMYLYRESKKILLTNNEFEKFRKSNNLNENSSYESVRKAIFKLSESQYRSLYSKAYDSIKSFNIKTLVNGDRLIDENANFVYEAKNGKGFNLEDLSILETPLSEKIVPMMDKQKNLVNPYFIFSNKENNYISLNNIGITDEKLLNKDLNLILYYLNANGYDRATFANSASYKLIDGSGVPNLFKDENSKDKKICFDGILGKCLKTSDKDSNEFKEDDALNIPTGNFDPANVTISYTIPPVIPDDEEPHVKKEGNKTEIFVDGEKLQDREINFNIGLKVDHTTLDSLIQNTMLKEGLSEKEVREKLKDVIPSYNDRGYIDVKDAFLIDVLPDGLELGDNFKIVVNVYKDALMENSANENFKDDSIFNEWKNKIEIIYIENLNIYKESLSESKKARLSKFIEDNKISSNKAVIVWLPEFEAPHGDKEQFKLELNGLVVSKNALQNIKENKAYFNSIPWSGEDSHKYSVKSNKKDGTVDKYLRLYDENGNIITDADKNEWFKGSAEVKFGDKFDYEIEYKLDNTSTDTTKLGGFGTTLPEFELEDIFPYVNDGKNNSLRPILRDLINEPENFEIIYLSKDKEVLNINSDKSNLNEVYGIKLKLKKGELFNVKDGVKIVIPMEIPELKISIKDSKAYYENGDNFDLELLKNSNLTATNKIEGTYESNPVVVE